LVQCCVLDHGVILQAAAKALAWDLFVAARYGRTRIALPSAWVASMRVVIGMAFATPVNAIFDPNLVLG